MTSARKSRTDSNHSLAKVLSNVAVDKIDVAVSSLSEVDLYVLNYEWANFWARKEQLPPAGSWTKWVALAGRGWGKTRTGAEWVRDQVENHRAKRIAMIGRTAADVRDVMVEGDSGILAISPPWFYPTYNPSKRRIIWPNGAIATTFTSEKPDQLRGPQHDRAWADEFTAWRYPRETWDQLMFGMRKGDPKICVTSTPRPIKELIELLKEPDTVVTGGTTYDNRANLADAFFDHIIRRYEGTRLGRQELLAEILDDVPGALWKRERIEELRVRTAPPLIRVVVAIDPPATSDDEEESAEAGIIVAGLGLCNCKGKEEVHGFVLEDYSRLASPAEWGKAATDAYDFHNADLIVGEVNNGGEMVGFTVLTMNPYVNYKAVRASRGKYTRAEPISALYHQGRIHHVGAFAELEDQQCTWMPGEDSPDRMDALVWAFTELFYEPEPDREETVVHEDPVEISAY